MTAFFGLEINAAKTSLLDIPYLICAMLKVISSLGL